MPAPSASLLNVGCGDAIHPDWVNVDSAPALPGVIRHDLRRALPFADASFDAVYGSHVLEHLEPEAGARLLCECHRILVPGGIVRIVVPDLETIAKLYLESLAEAQRGDAQAAFRYDWALLEMYDQSVRTVSGGRMAAVLAQRLDEHALHFVEARIGREAMRLARQGSSAGGACAGQWARRMKSAARAMRVRAAAAGSWLFLGREGAAALREGLFRRSGEVHQHMYDRFSLRRALELAGFEAASIRGAGESAIPGFARFGLELREGRPRKPDSLCLEARKPGAS
jgi:predicted SAM-dependent methyltransferase